MSSQSASSMGAGHAEYNGGGLDEDREEHPQNPWFKKEEHPHNPWLIVIREIRG